MQAGKNGVGAPQSALVSPVLAYHATSAAEDFSQFEFTEDVGFHFGTKETANNHLRLTLDGADEDDLAGARILPCLLDIKRPLRLRDLLTWGPIEVISSLHAAGVISESKRQEMAADGYLDAEMFRDLVEAAGYDSCVYANQTEGGGDTFIVLRAEHVRFALQHAPGASAKPTVPTPRSPRRNRP